jgi:hypothetical protein
VQGVSLGWCTRESTLELQTLPGLSRSLALYRTRGMVPCWSLFALCDEQEAMSASHHGVASQPPCEPADGGLVLRFTLQFIEMLSEQVADGTRGLEFDRQHAFR